MAGASMNDTKARIKSVQSTMQITKAMELVATSKLRRAKEKVESCRPFYEVLKGAIDDMFASCELKDSPFSKTGEGGKTLYIVIAGDRGLAGGYNANVFRLVANLSGKEDCVILPVGKKALEYYKHRNASIFSDAFPAVSEIGVGDCLAIAEEICNAFKTGDFSHVVLVYTKFVSMISQVPVYEDILPLVHNHEGKAEDFMPLIESDPEELLEAIVPEFIGGILWSSVCESLASESGARRSAMNAANKNAGEIIDTLMLKYNRARQAVITQEITEIVSGAEAL